MSNMDDLISKKKIRKPVIGSLFRKCYYRSDKYTFKEKVYTFMYREINKKMIFQGEGEWWNSHSEKQVALMEGFIEEFNKDYHDYCIAN